MKLRLLSSMLFVLLMVPLTSAAQASGDPAAVRELLNTHSAWAEGSLRADLNSLTRTLGDDLAYVHVGSNRVETKKEYLAALKSGERVFKAIEQSDTTGRVFDNTGVVTGRYLIKVHVGGVDRTGDFHYVHVYVRRNGRWQLVARHAAEVRG